MAAERSPVTFAGCPTPAAPLGVGTWAWGDRSTWGMGGYDSKLTEATIRDAFETSITHGVTLFDTAEVYGSGESERIIGRMLAEGVADRDTLVIATKFMPAPWKIRVTTDLLAAARGSLDRLGIETIDLYQLHGPVSLRSAKALAEALAVAHSQGLIQAVGVSNYSVKETETMYAELAARDLPLASNQIEFSLLRNMPETTGLLDTCASLGVVPLAYSPLGQGRLTGKYTAENPPPGKRTFSNHPMEKVDRIVAELPRIGEANRDRTPGQVALNWIMAKGAVPIPGAKNGEQAEGNAGALGWSLSDDEVAELDSAALHGQRGLSQRVWQHG